jgi:predicted N-acyltransferase
MPRQIVIFLAEMEAIPIAGALCVRGGDTLYGRYWGTAAASAENVQSGLHFETCYYQGIDYCLREGLTRFEPGAQGRHKIARGFLPTLVRSRHLVADLRFGRALGQWCAACISSSWPNVRHSAEQMLHEREASAAISGSKRGVPASRHCTAGAGWAARIRRRSRPAAIAQRLLQRHLPLVCGG